MMSYKRELVGIFTAMVGAFLMFSCATYNMYDTSFTHATSSAHNLNNVCGLLGAYAASICFYLFGGAAWILIGTIFFFTYLLLLNKPFMMELDRCCALFILLNVVSALCALYNFNEIAGTMSGGVMGMLIAASMTSIVQRVGTTIFLVALLWGCMAIIFRSALLMMSINAIHYIHNLCSTMQKTLNTMPRLQSPTTQSVYKICKSFFGKIRALLKNIVQGNFSEETENSITQEKSLDAQELAHVLAQDAFWDDFIKKDAPTTDATIVHDNQMQTEEQTTLHSYVMPHAALFNIPLDDDTQNVKQYNQELTLRSKILEEKLIHFGIHGSVTSIQAGPVVTLFEYQPHIETKISKILALEHDLALALQAMSIRILAPIPGKAVVGFEVANRYRKKVHFTKLLTSNDFARYQGILPFIIGEDTVGKIYCADLVSLPHLLIAGSTGSGKSVALNGLLMSLLYRVKPTECRLVLIDPKRLEFASYSDIPHLLVPPVTQASQASLVLRWLVHEMEERYKLLADAGVRNISDYNKTQITPMPFIVVVIDELADLMMTTGKEVEMLIVRLAQMARAAGIHLVVATQRPSVDVITGLIKVNFPSRIALRVTSSADSRTILDSSGAEKLVGKGDMLVFESQNSIITRAHGAYVSDNDIDNLVAHLRAQQQPHYLSMETLMTEKKHAQDSTKDVLIEEVVRFVQEKEEISISLLQRQFRIGYNRSARLIEELESQGMIMPAHSGKMRKVVRS